MRFVEVEEKNIFLVRARIGIFYLTMNWCGGGEFLTLVLSKILRDEGFAVDLITTERCRWPSIERMLGIGRESIDREYVIPPFVALPTIYSRFVYWLLRDAFSMLILKRRYDLTITTIQTFPIVFSDILYMHFPDFTADRLDRKGEQGLRRAYSLPYRVLCELFVKGYKRIGTRPVIVTNSKYTQEAIKRILCTEAVVVYPPVAVSRFQALERRKRRNIVLTISRIEEPKNLDILPQLASSVPEAQFVVVGAADRRSDIYLNRIIQEAKRLGVNDRVTIKLNCGEAEKENLLMQAKVYLHTMRNEHFGISIVEGMSAGLVPVVHKSGGPWFDILGATQGEFGYAYATIGEAAAFISEILRDEKLRTKLSKGAQQRAEYFDVSHFRDRMLAIVEPMLAA